jgi:hypothetical protein
VGHRTAPGPRRISDLRRAKPADTTLENLLQVINGKLELCSRLAVYEYEAQADGHPACAEAFRDLAVVERESFDTLLGCLRDYLDERPEPAAPLGEPA